MNLYVNADFVVETNTRSKVTEEGNPKKRILMSIRYDFVGFVMTAYRNDKDGSHGTSLLPTWIAAMVFKRFSLMLLKSGPRTVYLCDLMLLYA